MKETKRNILIAFILNLAFSIFEFFGGAVSGSVAIMSDAVHDLGDAISIGFSYFMEKRSQKEKDEKYTYGYARYSLVGGLVTTLILFVGSSLVIFESIKRLMNPTSINYDYMLIFAIIGVVVNGLAAYVTRRGDSLNQKAVNLHMLEDVLGWFVVLICAIVMRFFDIPILDPILSICVAAFILFHSISNVKDIMLVFLERIPEGFDLAELKEHLLEVDNVVDVHDVHVWSLDGFTNEATMHVVTGDGDTDDIIKNIKEELSEHGISHSTIELEKSGNCSNQYDQKVEHHEHGHHHHHHHHH